VIYTPNPPRQPPLLDFASLFGGEVSDLKLVCTDGGVVASHRVLLSAWSLYFRRALVDSEDVSELNGIHTTIKAILKLSTKKKNS
jgi:hypothetical protein